MSLRVYNRKRKFTDTPEPKGKKSTAKGGELRFVVQMHAASRLHFDLRLEIDGVFKSWAVPKGPSLNPMDQRLSIFVEDHPIEYGSFEGIIPSGNYGAGTVLLWDQGSYIERGSKSRKESELAMREGLQKGHLTFVLKGKKLKGEFALIRLKDPKSWLLVKKRDQYTTHKKSDVPDDKSVKSGRTIQEIAEQAQKQGQIWISKKISQSTKPMNHGSRESKTEAKRALPRKIQPMMAVMASQAPANWSREANPEGLRAIAELDTRKVHLYSKAGLSFDKKFPEILSELKKIPHRCVLDGEITSRGKKSVLYLFDILYLEKDLRSLKLKKRKQMLKELLSDLNLSRVRLVEDLALGDWILAKNPDSNYRSGTSKDWLVINQKGKSPQEKTTPTLTNLDKIYWPSEGITKGDLIDYYQKVSKIILPYLVDRPQSLNRFPNGITQASFFQKNMSGYLPKWFKTHRVFSASSDRSIDYALCQDQASLLYLINLGCIELNPWFSRVANLERPDFLAIDLDPDGNSFIEVVEVAMSVRELFKQLKIPCFVKTSGATGLHIGVPLAAAYGFDEARQFAEAICRVIQKRLPDLTSIDRNPNRRRGKIYLDYLQNRKAQTLATVFCVRPRPQAPVSMPLSWQQLAAGVKPEDFNIFNAAELAPKQDRYWRAVLGPGVDLPAARLKLTQFSASKSNK